MAGRMVRRVVTGHDAAGKAVFASDEEVEPVTLAAMPGSEFHRFWGADEAPHFPDDGAPTAQPTYFPPVGGYRFGMFTIPPAGGAPPELDDVQAALRAGDTVVQNGTRHRWKNPGSEPCHLAVFIVGAHHARFGT